LYCEQPAVGCGGAGSSAYYPLRQVGGGINVAEQAARAGAGQLDLLSSRWRPAIWAAGIGWAIAAVGFALSPEPLGEFDVVRNPFGLQDAGPLTTLLVVGGMLGLGPCWPLAPRW
jgi:hypothetical protein